MYFIVFARNKNKSNGLTSNLYYRGTSKTEAIASFNTAAASQFNVTSAAGNLYFAGFDSDLEFIKEIKKPDTEIINKEKINIVLRNIGLATCLNTLNTSGYLPKVSMIHGCSECDSNSVLVQKNAYGDYLCNECWAKYFTWENRASLAEYVVGLANGTYAVESFSEEDKVAIMAAWTTNALDDSGEPIKNSSNRQILLDSEAYTAEELDEIEIRSGLFKQEEA